MGELLLQAKGICKSFAGVRALNNVDLEIRKGEIGCLAGENGSGKSTLIKIISGAYMPDSGEINIGGKSYSKMSPDISIHEGIQVIYQDFSIFPNLTVAENIAMNDLVYNNKKTVNWKNIFETAKKALDKVGVDIDLYANVSELPVADKQLVAISRALLQNAKLIIMDEPTTALTNKEIDKLFKIIYSLKEKGISILFVSHKLEEVFSIAERITVLRNGEKIVSDEIAHFNKNNFIYYMTGRELEEVQFVPENLSEKPMLEVENLSKKGCFKDISFSLNGGEILGITGLLGSGRTELALSLFGRLPADKGTIKIRGKEVKIDSISTAIKEKIGYVPEDRLTEGLFLDQSIGKNIIVTVIDKLLSKLKIVNPKAVDGQIDHWIDELSIKSSSPKYAVKTLSGGNQQRVVLAKWLATDPDILILNGPTVGVDIGSKSDIHGILAKLAKRGLAVIIISDDIPEVLLNCNKILLIRKGELVGELDTVGLSEKELSNKLVEAN
jgi:simple sugar transport system ATP-binding protein